MSDRIEKNQATLATRASQEQREEVDSSSPDASTALCKQTTNLTRHVLERQEDGGERTWNVFDTMPEE